MQRLQLKLVKIKPIPKITDAASATMVRRDMIDLSYLGSHSTLLRIGYCYWGANKARVNEPA